MEFFCFEKGAMWLEKGLQKVEYIFKHSRVLLGTKPSKLFAVTKYYVPMQRVIICNISFKLPQHLLDKIAMLLQTVQNVCQSSKAFLWKMIICIYIYTYTYRYTYIYICIYMYFWKVKNFLANLWSIPPRCNMSLQQIPLMMQQCIIEHCDTASACFSRV